MSFQDFLLEREYSHLVRLNYKGIRHVFEASSSKRKETRKVTSHVTFKFEFSS